MRNRTTWWILTVATAALLLTGCGQSVPAGEAANQTGQPVGTTAPTDEEEANPEPADKAGNQTVELRFGTIDSLNPNGQYVGSETFVTALEEVSEGLIQVEMINEFGDGAADAESQLVAAIASGELDGGMPSIRAFADAGISGLQAIEAPMTITSYAAQQALVTGPVADTAIAQLDGTGIVGMGLAVGPLRRPFAADAPLLGPGDWEGARFRVYNSPVQADAVAALGAEPVDLSFEWINELRAGNLRGAEFDIAQYWTNGFTSEAGNVTANVVLWPKVIVLSISQTRWDALSEAQQAWVREAADLAVQASADATYDETTPALRLCDEGVRFVDASEEQLSALRDSFEPVIQRLADDPASATLLAEIQALAAEHPAGEVLDLPADCRNVDGASDETRSVPDETALLPEGLYRVDISEADVESAQLSNGPGWSGVWTLEISDGTYALSCRPLDQPGKDCGNITFDENLPFDTVLDAGYVRGTGNSVFFVYDADVHSELSGCDLPCFPVPTYELTWDLAGDTLTFTAVGSAPPVEKVIEPWRKIG